MTVPTTLMQDAINGKAEAAVGRNGSDFACYDRGTKSCLEVCAA